MVDLRGIESTLIDYFKPKILVSLHMYHDLTESTIYPIEVTGAIKVSRDDAKLNRDKIMNANLKVAHEGKAYHLSLFALQFIESEFSLEFLMKGQLI